MSITKQITIDLNGKRKPFNHFFRATGYANADYTYTPAVTRMYDYLSSYNNHPKYMRLHNIMSLHGKGDYYKVHCGFDYGNPISNEATGIDIVVKRKEDGNLDYDWTYVDKVYDIKTTSAYQFGKFERAWQKDVYPYCLVSSGEMNSVSEFEYTVFQLTKPSARNPVIGAKMYAEVYTYDHTESEKRLRSFLERFIEWLEANRERITDEKIFNGQCI